MFDVERLLAGRPLALDRSALPALASHGAMRIGNRSLGQLRAALTDDGLPNRGPAVRRVGSVAIVPLVGLITPDTFFAWLFSGTTPDALVRALQQAIDDPDVRSVILLTDSPGGDAALLVETGAEIRRLRAIKPITAIARTNMHSAAYWLASQATTVVATPSAFLGSVGVFTIHVDFSRLNERVGVQPTYISSSERKVEDNPDFPLSDDAHAFIQARVNQVYSTFVAEVAKGRRTTESTVRSRYGDGRSFLADEALSRKMVDKIAPLEATLAQLQATKGLSGPAALMSAADRDAEALLVALADS